MNIQEVIEKTISAQYKNAKRDIDKEADDWRKLVLGRRKNA